MFQLHVRGVVRGIVGVGILCLLIIIGSRKLLYFDAALTPYLYATIFATFGSIYRYSVWVDRPATKTLWKRSLCFVFSNKFFSQLGLVISTLIEQVVLQKFIGRRSPYRWVMHFSLAWGCMLAFAVTFPLVFGWLHFDSALTRHDFYQLVVFGFPSMVFDPDGVIGFMFFNSLNFCSLLVIIGTVMAFTRRFLHPGELSTQTFTNDLLPLLILFSVAVTGIFLSYSNHFLGGSHYRVLTTVHCWTVVVLLVYLPFGKFFHIFQRCAQLGAALYIQEKEMGIKAKCVRCAEPFTSELQKEDVKLVLRELGFQFQSSPTAMSQQDLCPLCRRHMLMRMQHQRLGGKFDVSK